MSQLINILVTNRGPLLEALKTPTSYGFDVEDIVSPITFNAVTNKSLFVARTNKGGINDDRNGSKINYATAETLAAITAKSPLLLLLTVVSRRGVDKNNEEYIFVSSKITESLTPISVGVGTRFYYIEDGDNLPVEYVVAETVAQIVAQSSSASMTIQDDGTDMPQEDKLNFVGYTVEDNPGNNSTDIIAVKPITYAALEVLRAAGNLPLGAQYLITDKGDAGIIVDVSAPDRISLRAKGLFLVPDFQNVGTYTTTPLPKGINRKVWNLVNQSAAPYVNGDIVFWDDNMYQVTDDTLFDSNSPNLNASAYTVLTKNVNNGYILECDAIIFNFFDGKIVERKDKRGNIVSKNLGDFQWGNNDVIFNLDRNGTFKCINQRGSVSENICNSGQLITITEKFSDNVERNVFGDNLQLVINDANLVNCKMAANISVILDNGVSYTSNRLESGYSDFRAFLDYSAFPEFVPNQLTIPTIFNYIGEFILTNNTGQLIDKIFNMPSNHAVKFSPDQGTTVQFDNIAIAGAVAPNLVADAVVVNTLVGRATASDFIEYKAVNGINVRQNIVKIA